MERELHRADGRFPFGLCFWLGAWTVGAGFATQLAFRSGTVFGLGVAMLTALVAGVGFARFHRLSRSGLAEADGIVLSSWYRKRFIPWADLLAVEMRLHDARWGRERFSASLFLHVRVRGRIRGYSIEGVKVSAAETFLAATAYRFVRSGDRAEIGPLINVTDGAFARVALTQFSFGCCMAAVSVVVLGVRTSSPGAAVLFAFLVTLSATWYRVSLRRRVIPIAHGSVAPFALQPFVDAVRKEAQLLACPGGRFAARGGPVN